MLHIMVYKQMEAQLNVMLHVRHICDWSNMELSVIEL